jgi:hypothetical protein
MIMEMKQMSFIRLLISLYCYVKVKATYLKLQPMQEEF